MTLDELNALERDDAATALRACCGSERWVSGMIGRRPFTSLEAVLADSDRIAATLGADDWREAFAHHPRIGEQRAASATDARARGWSAGEQAGTRRMDDGMRHALAEANRAYEARFGHIFLVCASGKSAADLLDLLRARLANDPARERAIAADEQCQITRLRLRKLLGAGEAVAT